jgi:hypothetical protein
LDKLNVSTLFLPMETPDDPLLKNRLDKQPIVRCVAPDVAFAARQKILDPFPLVVSQSKALHGSALRKADLP